MPHRFAKAAGAAGVLLCLSNDSGQHLGHFSAGEAAGRVQSGVAALNDAGYDWWTTDGKLVLEDPEYCASVSFTVGSWIETLDKYSVS